MSGTPCGAPDVIVRDVPPTYRQALQASRAVSLFRMTPRMSRERRRSGEGRSIGKGRGTRRAARAAHCRSAKTAPRGFPSSSLVNVLVNATSRLPCFVSRRPACAALHLPRRTRSVFLFLFEVMQDVAAASADASASLADRLVACTCAEALSQATQDSVQLFLALLPRDLRDQVDLLLQRAADWRHNGVLASIFHTESHSSGFSPPGLAVKRNGDSVVVLGSHMVRPRLPSPNAHSTRTYYMHPCVV